MGYVRESRYLPGTQPGWPVRPLIGPCGPKVNLQSLKVRGPQRVDGAIESVRAGQWRYRLGRRSAQISAGVLHLCIARKLHAAWNFDRRIRTFYFHAAWMFRLNPNPVRVLPDIQGNPAGTGSRLHAKTATMRRRQPCETVAAGNRQPRLRSANWATRLPRVTDRRPSSSVSFRKGS